MGAMEQTVEGQGHFSPHPQTPKPPPASSDGPGALPFLMPLVLIVEDDRRMRKYLRATLADQRFRVVDAENGFDGLIQASGHNPDLVLLDFGLPDFDGIQVTTKLR